MITARRIYLYGMLMASLALVLIGLRDLVRLPIEALAGGGPAGRGVEGTDLALATALLLVGAPLWAAHAGLLRRTMAGGPDARADELASTARAVAFGVVLTATLAISLVGLRDVATEALRSALGARGIWGADPAAAVAAVLVVGGAWAVHAWWRDRDLRAVPDRLAGDRVTRAYLYGCLFVLGTIALIGTWTSMGTLLQAAAGQVPESETSEWWRGSLAESLGIVLVATVAWAGHWWYGNRLRHAPEPVGAAHREARTRTGYLQGVVLVGAVAVTLLVASGLGDLLAWFAGAWRSIGNATIIEDAVGPWVLTLPFVAGWWWHQRRAAREALEVGGPRRWAAAERTSRAVVALVGVTALAIGAILTIGTMLKVLNEPSGAVLAGAHAMGAELAASTATMVVGLALWMPAWLLLERRRLADPGTEAVATSRRAYLLLVSGGAVIASMAAGAWLLYQVLRGLMDVAPESGASGPEWAVAVLLVAVAALAYHLFALRTDLRAEREVMHASAAAGLVEDLQLSGPPDADFEAVTVALRADLPAGFTLRVVRAAHR